MAEERLQRRLAAILSADVVGYSRLVGIDEAGTLARLKAIRRDLIDPAIAAHSGRTVKLMGDGALNRVDDRRLAACSVRISRPGERWSVSCLRLTRAHLFSQAIKLGFCGIIYMDVMFLDPSKLSEPF